MRKKLVNKMLRLTALLTIAVWVSGLFGFWNNLYGLIIMGLIIVFFVLIFVGFIVDDDFIDGP